MTSKINSTRNGHAVEVKNLEELQPLTSAEVLDVPPATAEEVTKTKTKTKPKTKKPRKRDDGNAWQYINLTLDAGSHKCKSLLNGFYTEFSTIFREIKGELPSGMAGTFKFGTKGYIVGGLCKNVSGGEVNHGYQNNKISKLEIWLLGALTHDCDYLDTLITSKSANKYKDKPIRLAIHLKLLSLSSNKKDEIYKKLNDLKTFNYRSREFQIEFLNLHDDYIYPEGYGAALTAQGLITDGEFQILDLGGGTLTLTHYVKGRDLPKVVNRIVATGGGMEVVADEIYKSVCKSEDRGGQTLQKSGIFAALKACRKKDDSYFAPYVLGRENLNIAPMVADGLQNWIEENPTLKEILSAVRQLVNSGVTVFATGGGFGCPLISEWVTEYLGQTGCELFQVLDGSSKVNVTGMKVLDRELSKKDLTLKRALEAQG